MLPSRRARVLVLLAALGLGGCRASSAPRSLAPSVAGASNAELRGEDARDPGLDGLGLVYDDTIITTSARTVDFNGQAVIPRYMHVQKSGAGRDLAVDAAITKVVIGLGQDFTVSVAVPYLWKRLDRPGGNPSLRSQGFGDTALVGKYRFYQNSDVAETTEAALLFGVKIPTGSNDQSDQGMQLPAPLQPGSGSFDPILGGAFTRIKGRWLLNADLIGKLNTEADGYRFGNMLRFDVGGHFRAYPARYERYDQMTVNLVAELNGVWSERDEAAGIDVASSGGTKLFATPGLQVIVNASLLFEAAVQLPVLMDLNGTQLEEDYAAVGGLRFRF